MAEHSSQAIATRRQTAAVKRSQAKKNQQRTYFQRDKWEDRQKDSKKEIPEAGNIA